MKKEITISAVTLKLVLIWIILAFLLVGLVALAAINIKNTTNQTFFIIFSLSIIFTIAYIAMRGKIKNITFIFDNNILEIIEKKRNNDFILRDLKTAYFEIKNYAFYYFGIKKWGYILRIQISNKNYFYFIVYENLVKITNIDIININNVQNYLKEELKNKYKVLFLDLGIKFVAFLPIIIFILILIYLIIYFI